VAPCLTQTTITFHHHFSSLSKAAIAAMLAAALTGCITSAPTYLQDGTQAHHVTCGGAVFSMGDCHKRAAELCGPRGYQIVAGGTESTLFSTASANVNAYGGQASGFSGSIINRDLVVKCGKPGAAPKS
jgi:hypothetical protein